MKDATPPSGEHVAPSFKTFDLSKITSVFSGAELTEMERAQLREIIELHRRATWLKKRIWAFLLFAVGVPSAIVGFWQAIEKVIQWIRAG